MIKFLRVSFYCRAILILIFIFCIARDSLGYTKDQAAQDTPNVIIIVFSGLRNVDSIDDSSHQYIPNLCNVIFKEGLLYTNLIDLNFQFHMPIISAISTGKIYPDVKSKLSCPSLFQYVRKKYRWPAHKLWVIGEWEPDMFIYKTDEFAEDTFPCQLACLKFEMSDEAVRLCSKQDLSFLEKYKQLSKEKESEWPQWDSVGSAQFMMLKKIMFAYKPKFLLYVMNDVESAHYDTFGRYVLSLKRSDERILEIWKIIQEDSFYKDNTYLIITPDHERNGYYMHHSENSCENATPVWMYVYGPGIEKNKTAGQLVHHIDIFPTLAKIFEVDTHSTRGKLLEDFFINEGK